MEDWKPAIGFEDYLLVSSEGRVRSLRTGKVLKQQTSKAGRKSFTTRLNGRKSKSYNLSVHRLVAEAFIPNPDNKPEVNHKDTNPSNNTKDNLEWVTRAENMEHYLSSDKFKSLDNSQPSKRILDYDTLVEDFESSGLSMRGFATREGVSYSCVQHALKYKRDGIRYS